MKKRTGLIVGIIAAVMVLAGAAAFIFAGDYITNQFKLLTCSDEAYFKWLSSRQIKRTSSKMMIGEAFSNLSSIGKSGEQGSSGSLDLSAELSEEFCDMLNIYSMKKMELNIGYASKEGEVSFSIAPGYGGNRLIDIRGMIGSDYSKAYAQIPDYSEDLIDLTGLLSEQVEEGKTVGDLLREAQQGVKDNQALRDKDVKELAGDFRRYAEFLVSKLEVESLRKGVRKEIAGEERKLTEVTVGIKGEALKACLTELVDMLEADGEFKSSNASAADIKELIAKIDPSTAIKICEYVDQRARLTGGETKVTVNSTSVTISALSGTKDGKEVCDIVVSGNDIEVLEISCEEQEHDKGYAYKLNVVPSSLVRTLAADYADMTIEMLISGSSESSDCSFSLMKGSQKYASARIAASRDEYRGALIDGTGKKSYPYNDIMSSDYLNVSRLVGLGLNIIDKIDEPFINDYINELLEAEFGSDFSLDVIREYYNQGLLDFLGGGSWEDPSEDDLRNDSNNFNGDQGNTLGAEDQPSAPGRIEGVISPDPADYTPKVWAYPAAGEVYEYSHIMLAEYALPGDYRGLTYTAPAGKEVSPQEFEKKKQEFLDGCAGIYTEDASTLEVQMGDEIYFDIIPVIGDYEMTSYTFSDCYAKMGEYTYGEGLDDMIIGMKVGETKDLDITLGEQYGDYSGLEAVFRMTLTDIVRYIEPSWTESFICGVMGYDSLDACSDEIMNSIEAASTLSRETATAELVSKAMDNTTFGEIPQDVHNILKQEYYDSIYDVTYQMGMRPEDYFASEGYDAEYLSSMLDTDVANSLRQQCFYAALAKQENITLTGEEVADLVNDYIGYYEVDGFEELMDYLPLNTIIDHEIISRIGDIIYESAVIK